MGRSTREAIAPAYLLLCLLLGGSAQGVWGNMAIELLGAALLVWAIITQPHEPLSKQGRSLLLIFSVAVGLALIQLVPLPPSLWPHLGGRAGLAEGYSVLGLDMPARPLSLTPAEGWASLVELIPPVALFLAIARLHAYRPSWLALALCAGTIASITLGALQATSADPQNSPWYLYRDSSFGAATGFFANMNHMGMLLLVTIPFLAAMLASIRGANTQRYSAAAALVGGVVVLLLVGILLNRSIAGLILLLPVLGASVAIVIALRGRAGRIAVISAIGLMVAAIGLFAASPLGERTLGTSSAVTSRAEIMQTTAAAARDFMPFGSGLGSFRDLYRLYEDHDRIDRFYVNHAHNDYLEIALELGLPGVILLATFLAWWLRIAWTAWRRTDMDPYARAAVIATAVLLAHSSVEFPLRTIALSVVFAMCLAFMLARPRSSDLDKSHLWPTRHVVFD